MKKRILTLCCCLLGLGTTTLFAQQGNVAVGGNASGTGGAVSFSIGQIFYSSPSAANYSIVQGLQQPYEISVVSGIGEKEAGISLAASVYPNPSVDKFTLKVETGKWTNLTYVLYDVNGKLLSQNKVESEETQIEVAHLASAQYFLKVSDGIKEIKTFKIIKSF